MHRKYENYQEYVKHQKAKLEHPIFRKKLKERSNSLQQHFKTRFYPLKKIIVGKKILCLGARTGDEVKALRDIGFIEAIGVDLNPGSNNKYVVKGDFHSLPFLDNSFDGVYSNSMDHAMNLKDVSRESGRVLKPKGILSLELSFTNWDRSACEKHLKKKSFESLLWESVDDVVAEFEEFEEIKRFSSTPDLIFTILKSCKRS